MKILCVLGESGSGKDTAVNYILEKYGDKFRPVITCTTRPKRPDEVDGKEYHFVKDDEELSKRTDIIEMREYTSVIGRLLYFTTESSFDDPDGLYVVPTSPYQYNNYVKRFGEDTIIPLYIYCDPMTRLRRSIDRMSRKTLSTSNEVRLKEASEICRRFLSDKDDYDDLDKSSFHTISNDFFTGDLCNTIDSFLNEYIF